MVISETQGNLSEVLVHLYHDASMPHVSDHKGEARSVLQMAPESLKHQEGIPKIPVNHRKDAAVSNGGFGNLFQGLG
jgi:hypothetical protein